MGYRDSQTQRDYQRAWIARRRAEWFAGQSCVACGSTESLELDHIDPTRKVSNSVWSWSKPRRDAEVVKCQVLCRTCHRAKSAGELPFAGFYTHHPIAIAAREAAPNCN